PLGAVAPPAGSLPITTPTSTVSEYCSMGEYVSPASFSADRAWSAVLPWTSGTGTGGGPLLTMATKAVPRFALSTSGVTDATSPFGTVSLYCSSPTVSVKPTADISAFASSIDLLATPGTRNSSGPFESAMSTTVPFFTAVCIGGSVRT